MDDPDAEKFPPSLKTAVRKARVEQAERSDVVNELRRAELARLEMLYDAFKPILAQVPANVDLFDAGVVGGERPRLFIDMIAFVEMAHDRRTYLFVQETRNGRVTLAESDRLDPMVEAMTDYIARRLVEREAALAADLTSRYSLKEATSAARPAKSVLPVPPAQGHAPALAPARGDRAAVHHRDHRRDRAVHPAAGRDLFRVALRRQLVGRPLRADCAEPSKLDGPEIHDMLAPRRGAAHAPLDLPAVAGLLERVEMIGGAMQRRARHGRGGRDAHARHAAPAALDVAHLQAVVVAVDQRVPRRGARSPARVRARR